MLPCERPWKPWKALLSMICEKDKDTMPNLYKIHREDEKKYISMYQQHNESLAELMHKDRDMDLQELEKAWTAANPET